MLHCLAFGIKKNGFITVLEARSLGKRIASLVGSHEGFPLGYRQLPSPHCQWSEKPKLSGSASSENAKP